MCWCLFGAQLGTACRIAISGTGALHAKAVCALSAYDSQGEVRALVSDNLVYTRESAHPVLKHAEELL
jgi:hypothetical protein